MTLIEPMLQGWQKNSTFLFFNFFKKFFREDALYHVLDKPWKFHPVWFCHNGDHRLGTTWFAYPLENPYRSLRLWLGLCRASSYQKPTFRFLYAIVDHRPSEPRTSPSSTLLPLPPHRWHPHSAQVSKQAKIFTEVRGSAISCQLDETLLSGLAFW